MRSKFKWIFTLLVALTMQFSFAQEKTVTGTITDGKATVPMANVKVKGTNNGVQSDLDGKFSIKAKAGDVLVISFLGYESKEVKVGTANSYNVVLVESSKVLDEVIVQGYGKTSIKKKDPGSSATVSGKAIENRPNVNFLQSIQGQLAGTNIALSSGQPGSNKIDVVIRGASSLNASTDPLYVIDGVPLSQAFFRNLNPNDVESVTVLKDASATAIYGNRGANGVILITTKKGGFKSKLSVAYSSTYGTTEFRGDKYNLVNAREHLTLQNLFGSGPGFDGEVTGYPGLVTVDPTNIGAYAIDTDWKKVFFRTGKTASHNISLTAGSDNVSNFTSLGYFEQEGIVPTTSFKRFTLRSNITGKSSNDKFNYGLNIMAAYSRRNQLEQETRAGINTNVLQNPLTAYLSSAAYYSPSSYVSGQQLFDEFGSPALQLTPFMLMDLFQDKHAPSFFDEYKTIITSNLGYKFTKNLTFTTNAGVDYSDDKRVFAIGPEAYLSVVRAVGAGQPFHGLENQRSNREFMFNFFNRLNYKKVIADKHTIDLSAYTEYMKAHRRTSVYQQIGLNPLTWYPGAGTGYIPYNTTLPASYIPTVGASRIDAGTFSYFGTVDYDYSSKYGFAGTIRRDASYRFVDANKWGTFWSVAGRWNINKENFMKDVEWIKDLKLRASYGTTGNQNIVARDVDSDVSTIFGASQAVRDLNSSQQGYGNVSSFGVSSYANTDLRWETVGQFNVGIDFDIKGRLVGSVDYYKKNTTDLYMSIPVSAANGITSISGNNGELQNAGVEVNLRYNIFKDGDFKLSLFANGALNKQKMVSLGTLDNGTGKQRVGTDYMLAVGAPAYEYFLVPYVGVNPDNGNLLFLDINNNITENPTDADRRETKKNEYPLYQGGFGLNTSYKGFFLDATFVYSLDFYRYDPDLAGLMDIRNVDPFPVSTDVFNACTPTNTNTDVPSWTATNYDSGDISDRFLKDASFVRLRNLSIGYDVPAKFLEKTFIKGLKIKMQGENFLTFTKWRGMDPESFQASATGYYPTPRAYTFGVDINF
ncbi:SusC/RagA family TonB-linked outer membrane protein [Flavobacterium stagni]|uniref:SusC/RagA family TonB-linked outer membrane protein n=1 Tax=Flavobacterium stagni TaxID=2506421 RepID=A0A4Q1K7V1_9FLAO|nr:SusC/RagA family TonB-linked outer membrane protein [Flavobacterium stagni]RXR22124.1 SusC/RagA family TonB-linked outer membrane protein [Flavobacterium stagni]